MYCPRCNSYSADGSKFCSQCGAPLSVDQNQNAGGSTQTSAGYRNEYVYGNGDYRNQYSNGNANGYNASYSNGFGYNEPFAELSPHLNNTFSIVMIIVNIVFFNVLGLIFSILSLVNYNDYENALRNRNYILAEQYKEKSKKYAKISLALQIIGIIIAVVVFVAAAAFGFFAFDSGFSIVDGLFDDEFFFDEAAQVVAMLL